MKASCRQEGMSRKRQPPLLSLSSGASRFAKSNSSPSAVLINKFDAGAFLFQNRRPSKAPSPQPERVQLGSCSTRLGQPDKGLGSSLQISTNCSRSQALVNISGCFRRLALLQLFSPHSACPAENEAPFVAVIPFMNLMFMKARMARFCRDHASRS